jgi:hypothetical protein
MTLPALYRPTTAATTVDYIALDGWTASGLDAQGTEWWLSALDGWNGTPDLRLSGVDRPQDHGQFDGPSYLGSRIITAAGTAISPDRATALLARDIMSSVCSDPSQLYTLQVAEPGRPTRRCLVRLNAATKVSEVNEAGFDWQLQLRAPDPRRYDDTETLITLTPPTGAVGGITVPLTTPFTISTSGLSTSSATATNAGTIATRPVITLYGPLVDPVIANLTAMRTLSFTLTLASGDYLEVDFDRRTVLLNGTASRTSALTSTAAWWELAPGGNDLAFTAGGGAGTAEIRFRSSWL